MTARLASLIVFATACASPSPRTAAPVAAPAPTPVAAPAPAPRVEAPPFDAATLVGVWVARESETPLGPIPFGFDFRVEDDGSVHAHTGDDKRFVDLRFTRTGDGHWKLVERAALPGVGDQTHTLLPGPAPVAGTHEWRDAEKPDFLAVRLTPRGAELSFVVVLRGEPHVRFELQRASDGKRSASMGR